MPNNPTGTIAEFQEKLGSSTFQSELNSSIQLTINGIETDVFTDQTSPSRVEKMNDLSSSLPAELEKVLVKGVYNSVDFYAIYGVDEGEGEVEVEEEDAPIVVKPTIYF